MADTPTPSVLVDPKTARNVRRLITVAALAFFGLACFALGEVWHDAGAWQQGPAFALKTPVLLVFAAVLLAQSYAQTLGWHLAMAVAGPVAGLVHFQTGMATEPVMASVFGAAAIGLGVLALLSIGAAIGRAKGRAEAASDTTPL